MASRNGRNCLRSVVIAALVFLAACGRSESPEDEIRAVVEEAEAAAEARDAAELRALVADDYADDSGRSASEVRMLLHAWLVAHPSVNLITRIDSIELDGTELARVQATVGMLGRGAKGKSDWSLAVEVERLDIRLAREAGKWQVIAASRPEER